MTHRVSFDPVAQAELDALYDHILASGGSAASAEGYLRRIVQRCLSLSLFPLRGSSHEAIRPGLRSMGFERRVTIAFVVDASDVTILRIFYAGRDTSGLLG